MPAHAWHRLGDYLHETQLLGSIQNTLYWDQNTSMPSQGASWRGEQLCLLARYLHARNTNKHFEALLVEAKNEYEHACKLGELEQHQIEDRNRNLELLSQEFQRQSLLDPDLVSHLAIAKAKGYELWQEARSSCDFQLFAPALRNLISLRKEQSKQLSEPRSCWETLAQPFEPDLTIKRVKELFDPLRKSLPELLEKVKSWDLIENKNWDIDSAKQESLCNRLLSEWGRDPSITSIARSPHPFSITLGPRDFRITTRVVPGQPLSSFLATAHEWGHSLYEQGLPSEGHTWFPWPLGQATSMAIHESQSLFWENRVSRSFSFAERFWRHFSSAGAPVNSAGDLWSAMNPLMPGLNRVEADELTYGFHILIRTDLEIELLENDLSVEDLPAEWNRRYTELIGITPRNDFEGCLQDVHWSEGQFGYFPSYLLGHLISAQLSEAMADSFGLMGFNGEDPIESCIRSGDESKLLLWLRKEVHSFGRKINAEELVHQVTGKTLSSCAFLTYLEKKIEKLHSTK